MLSWTTERAEVCKKIASNRSTLKLLLKTKDEKLLLQKWIDHHAQIVGLENLIIFDHGSEDTTVQAIYRTIAEQVTLCTFDGFLDNVHNVTIFPELYSTLKEACDYFVFLDTDEYLVWADLTNVISDRVIIEKLVENAESMSCPGTWLQNVPGFSDQFLLRGDHTLFDGLRWGKPIVSTKLDLSGIILHNTQLTRLGAYSPRTPTNFVVLHLRHLHLRQRVLSNMRKLVWLGEVSAETEISAVLRINLPNFNGKGKNYIEEIQRFSNVPDNYKSDAGGSLEIRELRELIFANEAQGALWGQFITEYGKFMRESSLVEGG